MENHQQSEKDKITVNESLKGKYTPINNPEFRVSFAFADNKNDRFIFSTLKSGALILLDSIYQKLYCISPPYATSHSEFINKYANKNVNLANIIENELANTSKDPRFQRWNCIITDDYILVDADEPVVYIAKLPKREYSTQLGKSIVFRFIDLEWIKINLPLTDDINEYDKLSDYSKYLMRVLEINNKFIINYGKTKIFLIDPYCNDVDKQLIDISDDSKSTEQIKISTVKYSELSMDYNIPHYIKTYDNDIIVFCEVNNDLTEFKYLYIKNHYFNNETNTKYNPYRLLPNVEMNIIGRLVDSKFQILQLSEFIKDDKQSKWIDINIPFIDPEREFITSIGIIENSIVVASYKNLYYTDIKPINTGEFVDFADYCNKWNWKLVGINTVYDYNKAFKTINVNNIPTPKYTISVKEDDNKPPIVVENDLLNIWSTVSHKLKLGDAYALTLNGTPFRFMRTAMNELIIGEIYINGIKLINQITLAHYCSMYLFNNKYIVQQDNIEEEHYKFMNRIDQRFSVPPLDNDEEKANLLLLKELLFP